MSAGRSGIRTWFDVDDVSTTVTVAAPALSIMKVEPIVAHFFVFYYGVLADITPPVALAAYAGASMAGADPFKTAANAVRQSTAHAV